MTFRLFDTHCHLTWHTEEDPIGDRISRAKDAGIRRLLTVGVDLESSLQCAKLAKEHSEVSASVGIHPNDLGDGSDLQSKFADLSTLAKNQDFCAIGETGLDFFREWCPPPIQKSGFEFHLRLGRELELPVIIHCRDAGQAVLEVLRGTNSTVNGVMHCYSESPELVQAFLDLGLHISFAGNLTYPKSSPLREAASLVPSDRLLIETDAPFLSPQPKRGKRNEPAYIVHTLSCLAEVRGETVEALAKTTYKNSEALFGQNKQSN